jgi:hypothetical protein
VRDAHDENFSCRPPNPNRRPHSHTYLSQKRTLSHPTHAPAVDSIRRSAAYAPQASFPRTSSVPYRRAPGHLPTPSERRLFVGQPTSPCHCMTVDGVFLPAAWCRRASSAFSRDSKGGALGRPPLVLLRFSRLTPTRSRRRGVPPSGGVLGRSANEQPTEARSVGLRMNSQQWHPATPAPENFNVQVNLLLSLHTSIYTFSILAIYI